MAFDEFLVDRIRQIFKGKRVSSEEKKIMGVSMPDGECLKGCGHHRKLVYGRIDPLTPGIQRQDF